MKKKQINLKWAKNDNDKNRNFGDDLSPYIINKLSGISINYIYFANTRLNITKGFILGILNGKLSLTYIINFIKSFVASEYIISIGSIIQWYGSSRCNVWGSGIINRTDKINRSNFLAVRGEYTRALIKKLGFKEPDVLGDPALLLPLIYSPIRTKKYRLGIIPHYLHYDIVKNNVSYDDILIIKLNTADLENVIDEICSCEYTISTSLHGIIVSHAYNIKSLWYEYDKAQLSVDNVKFLDYFSSVGIAEYKPFNLLLDGEIESNEIINTILSFNDINKINIDIKIIQKKLIDAAPFSVKPEFLID